MIELCLSVCLIDHCNYAHLGQSLRGMLTLKIKITAIMLVSKQIILRSTNDCKYGALPMPAFHCCVKEGLKVKIYFNKT